MLSRGAVVLDLTIVLATIGQVAALSRVIEPILLHSSGLDAVLLPAAALMALAVVRASLLGAREVVGQRAAARAKSRLRRAALAHVIQLGPSFVQRESGGELIALLGGGLERLDEWVSRYLPQRVLTVSGPLVIAAYVCWLDPLTAALLLVSAPVIPLLMVAVGSHTDQRTRAQWTALTRLSAHLLDVIQGLPTLKLFGRLATEEARVAQLGETLRVQTMQVLRQAFLSGLVLEVLTTAAVAVVAVELGLRLLDAVIGFGAGLQILLLAPEFYRPLRELGTHRHAALEARPVLDRLDAVLRLNPATPAPVATPPPEPRTTAAVALVGVGYRYPDASTPALDGVHLSLERGSRTAIVGPSGAGKSTLVHLLARFLEPAAGAIYADGMPIASLTPEAWRERIALVPQRPYLFDSSALDNLRLSQPDAPFEEVRHAAVLAGADEFLRRLPHGYNTPLGERGARLSRGQAQRLAIARAFLKRAPLLILDEPTSALDPESECMVRESLERLGEGRTVLVVAHRLNTVKNADRIVVLKSGKVVEQGSHHELLEQDGLYASFVGLSRRVPVS